MNSLSGVLNKDEIKCWIPDIDGDLKIQTVSCPELSKALFSLGDMYRKERDLEKQKKLQDVMELIAISISKNGLIK